MTTFEIHVGLPGYRVDNFGIEIQAVGDAAIRDATVVCERTLGISSLSLLDDGTVLCEGEFVGFTIGHWRITDEDDLPGGIRVMHGPERGPYPAMAQGGRRYPRRV